MKSFALLAGLLGCTVAHAQQKRAVTLADLMQVTIPDVTFSLSPDGSRLAYAIANESVWIVEVKPGAAARQIGRGFLPAWSPKGDRVAFYSTDAAGPQLWTFDLTSQRATQLTHVAGGIDPDPTSRMLGWARDAFRYSWSPDGKQIVFASRVAAAGTAENAAKASANPPQPGAPLVLTNTTPPEWTLNGVFAQQAYLTAGTAESKDGYTVTAKTHAPSALLSSELFVVDVANGATRQLTSAPTGAFNPDWSPDGSAIVFSASEHAGAAIDAATIQLFTIDPHSRKRRAITTGPGIRYRAHWSTDGARVAYLQCEQIWGMASVVVQERKRAQRSNLAAALDRHVLGFTWTGADTLAIQYQDGISSGELGRAQIGSRAVTPIGDATLPREVSDAVAAGGTVVWSQADPRHPGVIMAMTGNEAFELLDLYPQAREFDLGGVQVIRWKSPQGDELEGTLLTPPGAHSGPFPLIVDAYPLVGGEHWFSALGGNYAWASAGYAVFRPSARGPHVWMNPWRGATSTLAAKGTHGWDVTLGDVESGVDQVIALGIADPDRMCLYGFSNGGSVVDHLVTKTNRYRCAISIAPALADWLQPSLLDTDSSWLATTAGVSVWDDPAGYDELSPVLRAPRVKTPMLLAVGDHDTNCLLASIAMYNGLRHGGSEVTFVRYPDQGHGFGGAALEDFWSREMAFFARYLHR